MDENAVKITEIIDNRLGESYDMKSMTLVAKVAMRCVQAGRPSRPSMSEVVAELKQAIKLEDLLTGQVESSKRKGMEWSDDSSNISQLVDVNQMEVGLEVKPTSRHDDILF